LKIFCNRQVDVFSSSIKGKTCNLTSFIVNTDLVVLTVLTLFVESITGTGYPVVPNTTRYSGNTEVGTVVRAGFWRFGRGTDSISTKPN
jgi:hypothetical protein